MSGEGVSGEGMSGEGEMREGVGVSGEGEMRSVKKRGQVGKEEGGRSGCRR